MRKIPISEPVKQAIISEYSFGKINELAYKYRIPVKQVSRIIHEAGLSIKSKPRSYRNADGHIRCLPDEDLKRMEDLYLNHYKSIGNLAREFGVSRSVVTDYLNFREVHIEPMRAKYFCDRNFFENIDSEEKAYILGVIMSDGCVANNGWFWYIAVAEDDRLWLEKIRSVLKAGHPIHMIKRDSSPREIRGKFYWCKNLVKLAIGSIKMVQDLARLGIFPRKSLTIRWPNLVPVEFQRHMLRGLFDGDGSIVISNSSTKNSPTWKLASGSKRFLEECREYIHQNCGLNLVKLDESIDLQRPNGRCLKYVGRESCRKLYHLMYDEATIWLDRKRKIFEGLYEEPTHMNIFSSLP